MNTNNDTELAPLRSFTLRHLKDVIFYPTLCLLLVILVNFLYKILILYLPIAKLTSYFFTKISSLLIIAALTWILVRLVEVISLLLLHRYNSMEDSNSTSRKIHTQVLIVRRLIIGFIFLLSIGSSLMLFDNVRALGASMLTTAGIAGLIITFAAQRSLGSVFAGLEIALTQPIKIGDLIKVEGEVGAVEEINFRSVIIKLWDLRRLSVPTSYFLENPFQNWSKQDTNNLIGTVVLYADFTLPLSQLRNKVKEILNASSLWDGKTSKVQVNDLQEQVMQIRILASARNAEEMSNLCCELREKVISYLVENYPECLPMTRSRSIARSKLTKKSFTDQDLVI